MSRTRRPTPCPRGHAALCPPYAGWENHESADHSHVWGRPAANEPRVRVIMKLQSLARRVGLALVTLPALALGQPT